MMRAVPLFCYQRDFRTGPSHAGEKNTRERGIPSTMTTSASMLSCHYSSWRCPAGNIWKAFDTQWKTPEEVLGLRVTYVALKAMCDRVVFLSTLDRCVVDSTSDSSGELTKCQGSTPRLVEPSVTSGPCTNSYESLVPSFPFRLSFKLNKVTDHHKRNIHIIVWRKKGAKWNYLLCCVWIINKYSHLCWASSWWRTQPTIWNRHIFILFITSSHFSTDCQDWKLKDEEEKEQTFCG